MRVLCPECCILPLCNRVNHRISKLQALFQAHRCSLHGEVCIQINHRTLLHRGCSRKRFVFATLPQDHLENFVDTHRGNQEKIRVLDSPGKKIRRRFIREACEPHRRIHQVHKRSPSRTNEVSIPFKYPRRLRISRIGMLSIRFRKATILAFSPGRSPIASRIFRGMTTWNFGEIVTVSMRHTVSWWMGASTWLSPALCNAAGPVILAGSICIRLPTAERVKCLSPGRAHGARRQFTSEVWTGMLKRAGVRVRMEGALAGQRVHRSVVAGRKARSTRAAVRANWAAATETTDRLQTGQTICFK